LPRVGGKVDQPEDVRRPGDTVDCGLYELDPRRRLMVMDPYAAMGGDGGICDISLRDASIQPRAY
jgi:hypothetical protein